MNFDELVDQEVLKVGKVVIQLCRSNFFLFGEFYNKWAQTSQSHYLEIRSQLDFRVVGLIFGIKSLIYYSTLF